VRCGATDDLEIDHIHGDGAELGNLQVLCKACNGDKARALFKPATAPGHREAVAALWRRILASKPARVVDDVERWQAVWRKLQLPKPSCEMCGRRVPLLDGMCEPCAEEHAEARAEYEWEQTPEGAEHAAYMAELMARND
jgi:hypothetical protein